MSEIVSDSIPSGVPPKMRRDVVEFKELLINLDPEAISIARGQIELARSLGIDLEEMAFNNPEEMSVPDWAILCALREVLMGRPVVKDKTKWSG